MSGKGTKRARNDKPEDAAQAMLPGRDQLLLTNPELQARHGKKYCDEAELLPLLLAHGLVRRVRTIADATIRERAQQQHDTPLICQCHIGSSRQ